MDKLLRKIDSKEEKYLVFMKILSLMIPVREEIRSVNIEWTRGNKKTELKDKAELSPQKTVAHIN
jgi:hypothetical protein